MAKNYDKQKIDLVQMFDRYVDREYYKIIGGVIFSREIKTHIDRLEEEKILNITTIEVPDKIYLNGLLIK